MLRSHAPLEHHLVPRTPDHDVGLELDKVVCGDVRHLGGRKDAVNLATKDGAEAAEVRLDDAAPLHVGVGRRERRRGWRRGWRHGGKRFEGVAVVRLKLVGRLGRGLLCNLGRRLGLLEVECALWR